MVRLACVTFRHMSTWLQRISCAEFSKSPSSAERSCRCASYPTIICHYRRNCLNLDRTIGTRMKQESPLPTYTMKTRSEATKITCRTTKSCSFPTSISIWSIVRAPQPTAVSIDAATCLRMRCHLQTLTPLGHLATKIVTCLYQLLRLCWKRSKRKWWLTIARSTWLWSPATWWPTSQVSLMPMMLAKQWLTYTRWFRKSSRSPLSFPSSVAQTPTLTASTPSMKNSRRIRGNQACPSGSNTSISRERL